MTAAKKEWRVYILSCADASLYTGISKDIGRRFVEHQKGKASKYTRARLPVTLVAVSESVSHSTALKWEHAIKQQPKHLKESLIRGGLHTIEFEE